MRTSSLILISLRLYAIYWLLQSMAELVTILPMFFIVKPELQIRIPWPITFFPVAALVFSIVLWLCAARISGAIVRGQDSELSMATLSREGLYGFAFVFLGLYFILSSINGIVDTGFVFFTRGVDLPGNNPEWGKEVFHFLSHVLTLVAGFACVLGAGKWSQKLLKKVESGDQSRILPP